MSKLKTFYKNTFLVFGLAILFMGISSTAWSAQSDYDGSYAGTYSGDDSGYWVAVADASGSSAFLSWSTTYDRGDAGILTWWNEDAGIGNYYTNSTEIQGSFVDAYINSSDDSVDGTWSNSQSGDNGSLEGDKLDSSAFSGNYAGSFCGDDSGNWSITIGAEGEVTGNMDSNNYGNSSFVGVCHPAGYVFGIGENNGEAFAFFGQLSGSNITGEWIAEDGSTGVLSTGTCNSGGGDDDDDGGGGGGGGGISCYIDGLRF
jgi:hypothetical protein